MKAQKETSSPTIRTVKRLFALSGNECAFPNCSTPLIDKQSKSVIGQICHIKGEKPKAPRYDPKQTNKQRHSFDNLILLCSAHHKVVDDDESAYTVEDLLNMKHNHESIHEGNWEIDKEMSEKFTKAAISECNVDGSILVMNEKNLGQVAHNITNIIEIKKPDDEELILDAKLKMDGLFKRADSILP
jgi:hypothetical protein